LSLITIAVVICASGCPSGHSEILVKAADSGKSARLATGDTLLVTLETTPGTGYGWRVTSAPCLREAADPLISAAASGLVGAPQNETFTFEAGASPCSGSLRLDYVRPWEQNHPSARTFILKLTVD